MKIFYDRWSTVSTDEQKRRRKAAIISLEQKQSRKDRRRGLYKYIPLLHTALIAALIFGLEILYAWIVLSARTLRWFFVPTVFVYFGVLSAVAYWFGTRVERLKERELMGDEWFFSHYPLERWLNRVSKRYGDWQLRRIRQMREARAEARVPAYRSGVTQPPACRRGAAQPQSRTLRGPELEDTGWLRSRMAHRSEARREAEREKLRSAKQEKRARERLAHSPDLPESGFASWYETNSDRRQIIR